MKAKANVITAMLMFGSIGLFVRGIALPSSVIALVRGIIGFLFLVMAGVVGKMPVDQKTIKRNWLVLLLSGAAIGFNWIFLFEAYRYTTVARATLSYYFAPVFVILVSPVILGEKLTARKLVCVAGAVLGMVLVSGVLVPGDGKNGLLGIFFGLMAAVLYASVMVFNKFLKGLSGLETTAAQLGVAAFVLLPYTVLTAAVPVSSMWQSVPPMSWLLLVFVGVVHTGVGYLLYFSGMKKLPAQTVAVLSYIDPVTAIILSALILRETMNGPQIIGAVLILGMTWLGGRNEEGDAGSDGIGNKNGNGSGSGNPADGGEDD